MVFQEKTVVCVKVNGQILRENGDTVTLPFGSEYSLLIKNLNSVRAQVSVSVDGKDATGKTKLIIPPNSSIELERFIKNGNLSSGNRFKFIERTAAIEKHRGIKADDGLIRVESWREHVQKYEDVTITRTHYRDNYPYYPYPWQITYTYGTNTAQQIGTTGLSTAQTASNLSQVSCSTGTATESGRGGGSILRSCNMMNMAQSDAGITVPGSGSYQQFRSVDGFPLESTSTVIVMRLRGQIGGKQVAKLVTVKTKSACPTCGKSSKSSIQFCGNCGTSLRIY